MRVVKAPGVLVPGVAAWMAGVAAWMAGAAAAFAPGAAFAQESDGAQAIGYSTDWQIYFIDAASPIMERIIDFHTFVLIITILIAVFVTLLLGYVMVRFRAGANPVPSKTTHNPLLEVLWTIIPVLILAVIAVPSFRLLFFQDAVPEPEMTLRVTGSQWFWTYEYPDNGDFTFDAVMLQDDELADGMLRLLETDNRVVLPVDTNIRIEITADDVIHSWALPAFGIKTDAVPGRINATWTRIEREGVYYGQCSELCGINHGFMPIVVEAVSKERFEAWAVEAQAKFARNPMPAARKIAARGGRLPVDVMAREDAQHSGLPREDVQHSGLPREDAQHSGLPREDAMTRIHTE